MGDLFHYLELRAQGRIKEHKFRKSWKAVLYMLEDAAAKPSQNQPCEFSGEPRATFLMDFSPSKLRVASTHGDHTVRVSNVRTGKCTHILTGHPRTPWCLAFSPTSDDILASGCLAGEIRIWDLMGGGSEVLRNPCRGQVVTSLAFHPGGQVLAFATMNFIYFWDWSKETPFVFTQTSHESERIRWLRFDPYGHYLYTGIGNLTKFHRDIAGAEMEVSSDGLDDNPHTENSRIQQSLNRARYQRLVERFMAYRQDRSRYERYGRVQSSGLHQPDTNIQNNYSNRARQRTRRTSDEADVAHDQSLHGHTLGDQSLITSQAVDIEAFASGDNSSGRRNFDSGSSIRSRQGELQARQRWGRYEPSFFTRSDDSSDNTVSSVENSNNNSNFSHASSNTCASDISDNVAFRMDIKSRQAGQSSRPYPRTNLFPPGFKESAAGPSSFSHLPLRQSSRSENAASEGLDTDEYKILPVDQEREGRNGSTRNRSMQSSGYESSCNRPIFMQQRDELHALLNRYVNWPGEGSSASSGAGTLSTLAPTLTSQSFGSSAASTVDYVEANDRSSSMPSLTEAAPTSLTAQQIGETHLCTADTNTSIKSDDFFKTCNHGSFGTQLQTAASTSTSGRVIYSQESTPATFDSSANSNLPSTNNEVSTRVSDLPEDVRPLLNYKTNQQRASSLEDNIHLSIQVVDSRDVNIEAQNSSEPVLKEDISHSPPLAAATSVAIRPEDSNSSHPRQYRAVLGKRDRLEQENTQLEQFDSFYSDGCSSNSFTRRDKTAQSDNQVHKNSLSGSQGTSNQTHMFEENNSRPKYSTVSSKKNTLEQSSSRNTIYNDASKKVSRYTHSARSRRCEEASKSTVSSFYSSSLPSVSDVRPRCTNPLLNNFEATSAGTDRSECPVSHSRLEATSRIDPSEQNNQPYTSLEGTSSRTRYRGTFARTERVPDSVNTNLQNYEVNSRRTRRPGHRYPLLRHETASRTSSSVTRTGIRVPFSLGQSQTLRSPRGTYGGHPWGPYERLEYRHHLSAFHDRQIPRPVTDQTSQTLGAMNLPASNDQGTDVVGLDDAPVNLMQTGIHTESQLDSLTTSICFNPSTDQHCVFPNNIHDGTSNIVHNLHECNREDGSGAEVNRSVLESERFQRIKNIVRSVRAYLTEEYGDSFLEENAHDSNTESRSSASETEFQGSSISGIGERVRNSRIRSRHLRNVRSESVSDHTNRSNTERMMEVERNESVTGSNTTASQWNPDISQTFTTNSSTFVDANTSSNISTVHSGHGASAFYGLSTQVPSIHAPYAVFSVPVISASRSMLTSTGSDAPELDQFHVNPASRNNTSDLRYRPLSGTGHDNSPRFHPYAPALHRDRYPFRHRHLRTSRDLLGNYSSASNILTSEPDMMSEVPADISSDSLERSILQNYVENQPSQSVTSRLRNLSDSDQPSAFSIFSTSNREHQTDLAMPTSNFNHLSTESDSTLSHHHLHLDTQSQSYENLIQAPRISQDSPQNRSPNMAGGNLQESVGALGNVQQTSTENVTWRTPAQISLVNQVAVTEYLERRVIELDRRLSDLEQSYNSRLQELQLECLWRSRVQNVIDYPTRLSGASTGPHHDLRGSRLFSRAETYTHSSSSDGIPPPPYRQLIECLRRQDPNPHARVSEADVPTSVTISQARDDMHSEDTYGASSSQGRRRPWHTLRQIHLHPDYSRTALDDTISHTDRMGGHIGGPHLNLEYDFAVGSNMLVQTHRIQQWNITNVAVPNISDASANIIVRHCKLHNDASCNLAQDGTLLATIVPSCRGISDNIIVALFSLRRQTFAQCLFTKSFGPNAISISISPLNRYILVGLASRRTIFVTSAQMVGQVFRLVQEKAGENSMKHHKDIYHIYDEDRGNHVSVNSARWLPGIGEGLVYGTNRGDLHFFRVVSRKVYDRGISEDREESEASRRRATARNSIATQTTTVSIRRSASTQTLSDEPIREDRIETEEEDRSSDRSEIL